MADGFLGRWSRRKAGKEDDAPLKDVDLPNELAQTPVIESAPELAAPPASLEDVAKIDRFDPDFSAFMKPDVDPTVQQAALKKMFTDPHFNVMDGLDIYIDDYSKPDPLPAGMLERMVQSEMLNLFRKKSDSADQNQVQDEVTGLKSQPEDLVSEAQEQSDLISTQQKLSAQPEQSPSEAPNELSTQSEQKKT